MFKLPVPLHPVIVHFPIVLVLLGTAVAVAGIVIRRWHLPWIAAILLTLGSAGAFVAAETGEEDSEAAGELNGVAAVLMEEHESAAELTEAASAVAAVLAMSAAVLTAIALRRRALLPAAGWSPPPVLLLSLRIATAVAGVTACVFIYQTGHAGGRLVYEHGIGVKRSADGAVVPHQSGD